MCILTVMTCAGRQSLPLSSLRTIFPGQQWLHLASTMHLVTKSGLTMHCPPATCPNSPKNGLGEVVSVECGMEFFQMERLKTSTSRMTILKGQVGSRG